MFPAACMSAVPVQVTGSHQADLAQLQLEGQLQPYARIARNARPASLVLAVSAYRPLAEPMAAPRPVAVLVVTLVAMGFLLALTRKRLPGSRF